MKILIAPDSFKNSATTFEVCESVRQGILQTQSPIETLCLPMADGGEGSLDVVLQAQNGEKIWTEAQNPLGKTIQTYWGWFPQTYTAVIEMAKASGLMLLKPSEYNPLQTNTFGTGQLIKEALQKGAQHVIIFIGGSATNDAGAGMLQALGMKFFDENHRLLERVSGGNLHQIHTISADEFLINPNKTHLVVACDVTNPLLGKQGASYVFAAQKGATPDMIEELEHNMLHFANVTAQFLERNDATKPGSGAAGGLGFALITYCYAQVKKGAETIWNMLEGNRALEQMNPKTDLVITGEGSIDQQTLFGKVPMTVARAAKFYQIPVIGICGNYPQNIKELYDFFCGIYTILPTPSSLEEAIANTSKWIANTTENIVRTWYRAKISTHAK